MNCCDYDCTQGRDCPARAACPHCRGLGFDYSGMRCDCQAPARVTKVKRRIHTQDPLPASPSRAYMHHLAKWMLIALATMFVAALALGVAQATQPKAVDCRALIAGWHPDAPALMQRQCRKVAHA